MMLVGWSLMSFITPSAWATDEVTGLLATVVLERPLYLQTSAGPPEPAPPGRYRLSKLDEGHLKLLPVNGQPLAVPARVASHDQELEESFAFVFVDEHVPDLTYLVLLLPDGRTMEATGSATGTFPREIPIHIFTALAKQWATGSPVKESLYIEAKTIRAGQDYDIVGLPSGVCAVLCERDDRCQAFSWRPRLSKPTTGTCHLKNTVPPKQSDECCVSGAKAKHLRRDPE